MDEFFRVAVEEAERGLAEGGIPIGSVLVHRGRVLGRGHNRRLQSGSAVLHGEMDALENAGRQSAKTYRECTIYTTLSPCSMCSGAILLYGIPRVIVGENRTFLGAEDGYIAREFQRHFLLLGLKGGLAGAAGASVLFAILSLIIAPSMATAETDQVAALFGRFNVGPIGYFGALGIAFLIAVMTAVTSRLTVYRYLADND